MFLVKSQWNSDQDIFLTGFKLPRLNVIIQLCFYILSFKKFIVR